MGKEEAKEIISEKHWVINVLLQNNRIQLEKKLEENKPMFGYTIVPGGSINSNETQVKAADREILEEYGVKALNTKKIGIVHNIGPNSGIYYFRHVFITTKWDGNLSNPEGRNEHIEVTLREARELCKHPISQQILDLVETELSRQNS